MTVNTEVHSYLYQNRNEGVGQCLTNHKKEITSEGLHMKQLEDMSSIRDARNMEHMIHSGEDRLLRKKIIKEGANKNFANSLVAHVW